MSRPSHSAFMTFYCDYLKSDANFGSILDLLILFNFESFLYFSYDDIRPLLNLLNLLHHQIYLKWNYYYCCDLRVYLLNDFVDDLRLVKSHFHHSHCEIYSSPFIYPMGSDFCLSSFFEFELLFEFLYFNFLH